MNQFVLRLNCYLYGALAITLAFLLLLIYIHRQGGHFPNPFKRKNIVYNRKPAKTKKAAYPHYGVDAIVS